MASVCLHGFWEFMALGAVWIAVWEISNVNNWRAVVRYWRARRG